MVISCAVPNFCQRGVTGRKRCDHVMDSDIRFVLELIFDRLGVFDDVAAQAIRYWIVFPGLWTMRMSYRYLCSSRIILCRRFGANDKSSTPSTYTLSVGPPTYVWHWYLFLRRRLGVGPPSSGRRMLTPEIG